MYRQNRNNFNNIIKKQIKNSSNKGKGLNRATNGYNNLGGKTSKKLGYIFVFMILFVTVGMIFYVSTLTSNKKIFEWDPDVEDDEKLYRTQKRGTLISIAIMSSAIIQALMKKLGASQTMLLLLYGFFMAAVIGFMGDQAYGRDEGFSLKEIGTKASNKGKTMAGIATQIKYTFGTIKSYEFWRYIITVFLDMFISMPLQSVITSVFNSYLVALKNTVPLMPFGISSILSIIVTNFDNVLQSFVAFITFLAYANETRFRWAYPSKNVDPGKLISSIVIKLATSIAAIVYLVANVSADFNVVEGVKVKTGTSLVDRLDRKMFFAIVVIMLLTIGSMDTFPFMNYEPNSFYIAPIQKYKDLTNFWQVNKNDDETCNKLYKNDVCKLGRFSYCKVDEHGQLVQDAQGNLIIEDKIYSDNTNDEDITKNPQWR